MSVLQIKILLSLALLLLAAPVWAGEVSNTSGSLHVQVGAEPQPGVDSSRCFLNGELVPCVGHVYDQRVGSVAVESQGSVIVDRDVLQAMIREAEQQGGKLAVIVKPDFQRDKFGNLKPSPCYQKMREAMRIFLDSDAMLKSKVYKDNHFAAFEGGVTKQGKDPWRIHLYRYYGSKKEAVLALDSVRATYQECVK